jgi:hypothetical protein
MPRTTKLLQLFSLSAAACLIAGCEPSPPSPQELGRIVFKESEVPGADETYELPERIRNAEPAAEPPRRMPGE